MAVLLKLGDSENAALAKTVAYAKANIKSEAQLKAMEAGDLPPVGDYLEHQFIWPVGFRCVYSYERWPQFGLCRHLAVQVYDKSNPEPQVPAPHTMNKIGEAFGFVAGKLDHFWIDPKTKAFNMLQLVPKCEDCEGNGAELDGSPCHICAGLGLKL